MGKRVISRRRGRGGIYSSPSHRHRGNISYPRLNSGTGKIIDILHDPGRNVPLFKVRFDRETVNLPAIYGLTTSQEIDIGGEPKIGNILELGNIPDGSQVCNIEGSPGDGGKYIRAAGTYGTVISHGEKVAVRLPSGQFKSFNPKCRATIGNIAGSGRKDKPFVKAGKKYHAYRSRAYVYPDVSGVAMNPVSHPHGGGSHQHVGRPSTVSHYAWPGRKVGRLGKKRRKVS
ncbi:MAG: 50S ribosomal protein L2 [Candidatus Thermoplasmatota archaeon]